MMTSNELDEWASENRHHNMRSVEMMTRKLGGWFARQFKQEFMITPTPFELALLSTVITLVVSHFFHLNVWFLVVTVAAVMKLADII